MTRLALLVIALASTACAHVPAACDAGSFSPSDEQIVVSAGASLTSREFAGRLRMQDQDWPNGLAAVIELHGPDGFREFVTVAKDGSFARRGLRPGVYCFEVSVPGMRSLIGRFVLDWRALTPLEITL